MSFRAILRGSSLAGTAAAALLLAAGAMAAERGTTVIPEAASHVSGHMTIDFDSRREDSSSGLDTYTVEKLTLADLLSLNGTIQREPETSLAYSLRIDVFNPADTSQVAADVAILRGTVAIDKDGRYQPTEGALRIDIVKGSQSTSPFEGAIQGRQVTRWWEIGEQLDKAQEEARKLYSRTVNGKTVTIAVANPDPLAFENLVLAAGPFSYLPQTTVNGNLDYDYELGNWLTDQNGVTFKYNIDGQSIEDRVTGSIRFVEEKGTFTDGAGASHPFTSYYDYSLRFNEPVVAPEDAFFDNDTSQEDLDDFFSDTTELPGLYGRVYYFDSEDGCETATDDSGETACVGPTRSEVYYEMKTVGLTYAQLANWYKLELLIAGPMNDE
jgi:hypothetical protein